MMSLRSATKVMKMVHCDRKKCRFWEANPEAMFPSDGICLSEHLIVIEGTCQRFKVDEMTKVSDFQDSKQKKLSSRFKK